MLETGSSTRTDISKEGIKNSFLNNRSFSLAKDQYTATSLDNYRALSLTIRDRIVERWIQTQQRYHHENGKRVYYLSMEFLIGRLMGNYVYNLGLEDTIEQALEDLGLDMDELRDQELDAGLGNGGLGRLAACFLDSMATLGIPSHGYGIRYDYGIFKQEIKDGHQIELPDEWLRFGNPWEFERAEYSQPIHFYGRVEHVIDESGHHYVRWVDTENILAVPYDIPIPGYKNDVVNTLRLWSARSVEEFDLKYFNTGDYGQSVLDRIQSETISKVLYPNDETSSGKELRLKQEYFFTAAAILDIMRRFKSDNKDLRDLPNKVCIQLNDTHPAVAISELMRILIDEERLGWDVAWEITQKTFAYTNHTLMPEALECWSSKIFGTLLPRHISIIYEINDRFLKDIKSKFPSDTNRLNRMSIVSEEGGHQFLRMAHLAIVGSFSVNGVAQLHTDLLEKGLFKDFYEMYPEKFNNKTNGITQRRWLLKANPDLSQLATSKIGGKWVSQLDDLKGLEKFMTDKSFCEKWWNVKQNNKEYLVELVRRKHDLILDPESMFDVQVKRIHEYKRQLLFAFYVISQYLLLKNDPDQFICPRTFIIGGKAAPGYKMAKLIIKFINNVAQVINADPVTRGKINLVFLENYRVSLAERIFPASDLSEQISTAGYEASGTGNMKFMLNGALTIGTLDGANVEMNEALNEEGIFIFGLKEDEVSSLKSRGYNPQEFVNRSPMLKDIFHLIQSDFFSPNEQGIFEPIIGSLLHHDTYMICADFDAYFSMQQEVSQLFLNQEEWIKQSIRNVACSGRFSSDRTIYQYAKEIWGV